MQLYCFSFSRSYNDGGDNLQDQKKNLSPIFIYYTVKSPLKNPGDRTELHHY